MVMLLEGERGWQTIQSKSPKLQQQQLRPRTPEHHSHTTSALSSLLGMMPTAQQPLRVSERTWWLVLKEKHWQQRTLVPKKVLFPIVLDWWFHSAPLVSLWISFLNYFRFCGAEWSFDVKKL